MQIVKWLCLAALWPGAQGAVKVYVVDSLTRVRPSDAPRSAQRALLQAARNEYAPFQIAVSGDARKISAAAGRLQGPRGHSIAAENIALYREHYVEVKTPSPLSTSGAGWYPDALVPLAATAPGPEPCVTFWVDLYVPRDATPGWYTGAVTITADGEPPVRVPIRLEVWNFTLPDKPSMRSNFGSAGRMAAWYGAAPGSSASRAIDEQLAAALAANRLSISFPASLAPEILADGTARAGARHETIKAWIEKYHLTGFPVSLQGRDPLGPDRARNVNYLRSIYAYLRDNGWQDLAYIYVLDEPNTFEAYETVRKRAAFIHQTQPGIKVLCTEQPTPQDSAWGTLAGSVDIWVPLWPLYEEADANARLAAGEEMWSYTALTQAPKKKATPFWQLDFPLLNYRIPMWINWRCGITGLLYWTAVYWDKSVDMWTNPLTFRNRYNLEGLLFYPGEKAGLNGLIHSMRIRQIRQGEQDYEYFCLAAGAGQKDAADRIVRSLARSWTDWDTDPAHLYAAREEIARLILRNRR